MTVYNPKYLASSLESESDLVVSVLLDAVSAVARRG